MGKYLCIACLITFFNLPATSQTWQELRTKKIRADIDSLKKVLPSLSGTDKVDCLNTLAHKYFWLPLSFQQKNDSSLPYTMQAQVEAKKIGYKRGLGFTYLRLADYEHGKAEDYYHSTDKIDTVHILAAEKLNREAVIIGEEIKDNVLLGGAWWNLSNLLEMRYWNTPQKDWKKEIDQYESYLKKAISYHEKDGPEMVQGTFREQGFVNRPGCKGNERWLGGLHWALSNLYKNLKREFPKAREYAKQAIAYYEKGGEEEWAGRVYRDLSTIGLYINNTNPNKWDEAIENTKKAIHYFQKTGGYELDIAKANKDIGNFYFRKNDFATSFEYLKRAVAKFHNLKNENEEYTTLFMLCAQYVSIGDFENGIEYCKRSVELIEKLSKDTALKNPKNISWGSSFVFMCKLYKTGGDYETALEIIRKGHKYYPLDSASQGVWAAEIGDVFRLMGKFDSAMHYLRIFENKFENFGGGKSGLASLYLSQKQYSKALAPITAAIKRAKELDDVAGLGNCLMLQANIYLGLKNSRKALKLAKESAVYLTATQRRPKLIENYDLLSQIYHSLGKNDSAYYYARQYTSLKDSLLSRQFYWRLNNFKKQSEEERKTSQINLLNKDNELKQQQLKQEATLKKGLIAGLILLLLLGIFIFRNLSLRRRNELQTQKLESEKKQAELEMQALRAQMNPHFIFNCLSSINRFILKNESKIASNYLTRFSRLMRMVLMNSQKPFISLDDELEMLEIYLEMERLRFKNSFDYAITFLNTIDSDNIFIPPLLLQPFCENAIWHGLMNLPAGRQGKEGQGRLDIELSLDNNILSCVIRDNGVGREKAEELKSKTAEKEKSMGLKITTERLALLNREKGLHTFYDIEDLSDESGNPTGTKVTLKISFKQTAEEFA